MEDIQIRTVRMDDLDAVTQIERICFPPQEAAGRDSLKARIEAFGTWFLVAQTADGGLVGMINGMATHEESIDDEMFADASLHCGDAPVQTVFGLDVLPQWRGRGIAGALVEAFCEAARCAGRKKVTLTCKERLIGMYEHFGFVNQGLARSAHGGAVWYNMDRLL